MELIVQAFLFKNYDVKTDKEKQTGIYVKNTDEFIYGKDLLISLIDIFSIDEWLLTKTINSWAKTVNKRFTKKKYWNRSVFWDALLPTINRIRPVLIGTDSVSVQPMSGPTGQIFYMDYQYSGATNQNDRIYQRPEYNQEIIEIANRQARHQEDMKKLGELNHISKKIRLFDL